MAYKISYSDYPGTDTGPPDPARWIGPVGPMGPPGPKGDTGATGGISGGSMDGPLYYLATGGTVSRSAQDRAADVINIMDYGAVADAQVAQTTATIAAGSATLTVTDPIFSSADVGKVIGVAKRYTGTALAAPYNPWANRVTIHAVLSPTQVTTEVPNYGGAGGPLAGDPVVVVWGTDNVAAFQAAANRARDLGRGCVYVPAGRYVSGSTFYLYSDTTLCGDGPASQIVNPGIPGSQGGGAYGPMFANYNGFNWPAGTSRKAITGFLPTTLANMIDHDITVRDLCLNYGAAVAGGNAKCALFILARKIKFLRNLVVAPGLASAAGISVIGGWDIEEIGNTIENASICLDHWGGIQKLRIISNTCITAASGTAIQAINVNAAGTTGADVNMTTDVVIADNMIVLNGGPAGQLVAMYLDALGPGGSVTECFHVVNNTIRATAGTVNNTGITMRGAGGRSQITGNIFDGLTGPPIQVGGFNAKTASLTTPWTVNSGETTALINFPAHGVTAPLADYEGPWMRVPNQTVAGITFNATPYMSNNLPVLAVVDANTLLVRLPSAATSSVVNGGLTAGYIISLGAPQGMTVSDNLFLDMRFPAAAGYMVDVTGLGHHIGVNKVAFRDPANPTCQYANIVRCNAWGPDNSFIVRHQAGPDGLGPTSGFVGTGNVSWVTGSKPLMPDDDVPTSTPTMVTGDETTAPANTLFAARMLGVLTIAMPDADTTFTPSQTGARFINLFGTLTVGRTITMPVSGQQRTWVIRNGTTGGFAVGVKGSSGSTAWIANGFTMEFWTDGTNISGSVSTTGGSFRIGGTDRNALIVTPPVGNTPVTIGSGFASGIQFLTGNLGFNSAAPIAKPTISGSRGGNAAVASLLTQLAAYGLITDGTTA